MLNSVELVGWLKGDPEISTTQKGNTLAQIVVTTDRNFRNEDGTTTMDTFKVKLWRGIAEQVADICKDGDMIGIRGRLSSSSFEKNDKTYYNTEVIAEHVDFLSHRVINSMHS